MRARKHVQCLLFLPLLGCTPFPSEFPTPADAGAQAVYEYDGEASIETPTFATSVPATWRLYPIEGNYFTVDLNGCTILGSDDADRRSGTVSFCTVFDGMPYRFWGALITFGPTSATVEARAKTLDERPATLRLEGVLQ